MDRSNPATDHPTPPTDPTPPDDHRPRLTAVYDNTWQRQIRPGTCVVHIIPVHDLRPHRAGVDCECQPQPIVSPFGYARGPVLLHSAWDCREHLAPDEHAEQVTDVLMPHAEEDAAADDDANDENDLSGVDDDDDDDDDEDDYYDDLDDLDGDD
jgi:hypothetical protein